MNNAVQVLRYEPETANAPAEESIRLVVRIFVADDDETVRQLNVATLRRQGYEVESASDGESAWEAIQRHHFDLLITDNNMPRLTGVELIRKLRSAHRMLPVILASGSVCVLENDESTLPAVTLLPKPYGTNALQVAVNRIVADTDTNDSRVSVERYRPGRKQEWEDFLAKAKNATFLYYRDYMDYHSDRFTDYSLMIYCEGKLEGLLPANLSSNGTLISHEGLTYGGLVVSREATMNDVLMCFYALLKYLHRQHVPKLLYKRIPSFYNTIPDDQVAYALFLSGRSSSGVTVRQPFRNRIASRLHAAGWRARPVSGMDLPMW